MSTTEHLTTLAYNLKQRFVEAQPKRGDFSAYVIVLALMGFALLARLAMAPVDAGLQYVTFFPAVTLSVVIGGFWPGIFATFIGLLLATFFFTPPYYSFSSAALQASFWSNMVFLVDGIIVCASIEGMHRYRAKYAAELKEAQYQEARVAALNKSLDEFTYIAAHDLKEPLRGIHNYASFLKEDYAAQLDETGRQYIGSIQRLAERLSTLIDSLMVYSRLGVSELIKDTVDVDAVVDAVAEDLNRLWTKEGIELRRIGRLGTVQGDSARIGEVFQNLFSNAAKYNDKPQKWIEVGCDRSGAQPVFYVRDNGIGIPPQHHDNVFRIFKRLHEQHKYGGGTGAGLTIVRKIVERYGGRIWLESVPGEGTVFYFTLGGGK
ncbi:MAG: ATP-binding protein [Gallionella sp.]|nr:ATP-binding protein [Gallionella sp.]